MSQTDNSNVHYPLVTVYMPTKNRLALLKRAIATVMEQTYPNIELIVVNDASTDGTFEYLEQLQFENDKVQVFHHQVSQGACVARNLALKNAKGEFVTGLDDDDEFLPNRIESLYRAYDDQYAFVCSSMWWDYGKRKRLIDKAALNITLAAQLSYNEATTQVFVEKSRILAVGGFDETFVACQDYDLWTRLIIEFGQALRIAQPSYIINDTATTERMIGNPKSVEGYRQFMQKHQSLMSKSNIRNQAFMVLRRQRKVMPFSMLVSQMFTGHFMAKLRYFLSSNFSIVKNLHRKFFK